MLTKCPECELPVSTNAITCPHCGNPLKRNSKNPTRGKSRIRLPNGFGQISFLKDRNLRNPYRCMVTVGKSSTGKPICKVLSYHPTYNDAYAALVEYNKNPYDLDKKMTVSEVYEKWTEQYFKNITESSTRTIVSAWSYCSSVYDMNIKELRCRHIKGCMESCNKLATRNRIKSMFNLMLDFALEYELVDRNYAREFKSESSENITEHIAFTDEELEILWKYLSIPIVNIILIQCYTGWRPQELCKLKRSDVNIIEMTMTGGMKTKAGINRLVPICSKISNPVQKIYEMSKMLNSEWFCCDLDGSELTYDKYNKRFHKTLSELGIEGHRPHDPRKTFITMAKNKGMDEYAIKKIVGHQISDITEAVYTERSIEWLKKEIKKLED